MKKYCYQIEEDEYLLGFCDTIAAAEALARERVEEDGSEDELSVSIWDARPATADDREMFEACDEDGEFDGTKPNWWADKWVPENIVHSFKIPAKSKA